MTAEGQNCTSKCIHSISQNRVSCKHLAFVD